MNPLMCPNCHRDNTFCANDFLECALEYRECEDCGCKYEVKYELTVKEIKMKS